MVNTKLFVGTPGDLRPPLASSRLAFAVVCSASPLLAQGKGASLPPATVVVGRVTESAEAPQQTFVGTLEPLRRSTVGSAVDGRVDVYPVNDGQWVRHKEVLADLRKDATEIEKRNAEAELAFRQAELDELLNGSLTEDKLQAKAKRDSADAQLKYAKAKHARSEALFRRGSAITQEDMDLAHSILIAAEKNLEAAEAAWKLIEDWPRPEKRAQGEAKVAAQEGVVDQLDDRLRKFTIRSSVRWIRGNQAYRGRRVDQSRRSDCRGDFNRSDRGGDLGS